MVLNNFLRNRETETSSVCFALSKEWFEDFLLEMLRNSTALVANANLDTVFLLENVNADLAGAGRNRLTRIYQQIVKDPFQLLDVVQPLCRFVGFHLDMNIPKLRPQADGIDGGSNRLFRMRLAEAQ